MLLRLRSGPATVTERTALAGHRIIELAPLIRAAVSVSQFEVQVDARLDRLEAHAPASAR